MIVYGIKNCDMTQKALKFLDKHKIQYTFHDYKVSGIEAGTIKEWLKHLPLNLVLNSKSTTFRNFSDAEKASAGNANQAIGLMVQNTSVIKRPLLDLGNAKFLLGFKEEEWEKQFPDKTL